MERHKDLEEKNLVLLFEREGEPVDDRSQDLQQLRHPVVSLCLVDEIVEDVVDLLSNVGTQTEKLAYEKNSKELELAQTLHKVNSPYIL